MIHFFSPLGAGVITNSGSRILYPADPKPFEFNPLRSYEEQVREQARKWLRP